jgi:O-antigen/teichoic acid export membrane protein
MHITFDRWRETWRSVAVFGGYFLFGSLFFVLDTILLSFWRGDRDVGIYQAAFKIVGLSLIVPDIAINTMIPVLARLHADGDERWAILGRLLNKMLSLVALPICMILFVYPDQIIAILYGGDDFRQAVPILRLFALTIYVRFAVDVYGLMMTTSQRQIIRMYIVIAGTVTNLALNAYMIPRYGPWGAALVSLVTNILVGVAYIIGSRQSFLRWTGDPLYVLSFCISLGIAILGWNFREVSVWLTAPLIIVLCGLIVYFVGFSREEWKLISARSRTISPAPGVAGG